MRNFDTLETPLKRKIIDRYIKKEIGFEEIQNEYNVSADSFKFYLIDMLENEYETFNPLPKPTFREDLKILLRKLRDNILSDIIVKLTLLFFLFRACTIVPIKMGASISPLASLAIEKGGIALLVYLIGKLFFEVFTLFTDRKEWLYTTAFVNPTFGYDADFTTLTPYQRCLLSLLKRAVRMLIYALLFLGVLMQ